MIKSKTINRLISSIISTKSTGSFKKLTISDTNSTLNGSSNLLFNKCFSLFSFFPTTTFNRHELDSG